jgi:hypothetical protein
MGHGRFEDMRFWATAPLAAMVLVLFATYFWGRRQFGLTVWAYPWAILVGIPLAIGNLTYNVIVATFVFSRLPVWRNTEGGFSPFFTTRIKAYRRAGSTRLVEYLAACINDFDPGHFADREA